MDALKRLKESRHKPSWTTALAKRLRADEKRNTWRGGGKMGYLWLGRIDPH
jgi:hypothetical protein